MPEPTAKRPALRLDGVSLSFPPREVLHLIEAEVHMGEFVYLVGRTGSGKSSLLKLLYADLQPEAGTVWVEDKRVNELSRKEIPYLRRRMGIVFQDFQLLMDRDVAANIHFALRATGWKQEAKIKSRISEVLMQTGLSAKAHQMPHQLSGGEQQRVAIARALINDPLILIADEPTGNLDPDAAATIMGLLQKINRGGTAVVMATHEYRLLKDYPARVWELREGKLLDYPESAAFLAGLLGSHH